MRKALLYGPKEVRVEEVETPEPGPGQVRVRVLVSGPYGTDIKYYRGEIPTQDFYRGKPVSPYPCGFGGESAGVIDKLGPGVTERYVGQAVTPIYFPHCGRCAYCLRGQDNLCSNFQDLTEEKKHLSVFQDYLIASVKRALPLPEGVTLDDGAMLGAVCCAVNVRDKLKFQQGESVLVIGGAAFGAANVQLAKAAGCRVVVFEHRQGRREMCLKFGAIAAFDPRTIDAPAKLVEVFGELPDHVIETSGSESSTRNCVEYAARAGKVATLGAGHYDLSAWPIMHKELAVYGVRGMTEKQRHESVEALARGEVDLKPMITHRFPLAKIAEAFALLDAGTQDQGRVLLDHND